MITPYSVFLRSFLQTGVWCLALFCSASRVKDNRHQMGDVVAGMVIGGAFAFWSVSRGLPLGDSLVSRHKL